MSLIPWTKKNVPNTNPCDEGVRQGRSSDKRVLEQSNTDWETAKTADNVIEMFKLLCASHNFYGKAASLVEQTAIRLKHDTFIWLPTSVRRSNVTIAAKPVTSRPTNCKKEKSSKPQKGKSKNKGEKVGSMFSALEVSDAVDSEDDVGFVASQGVVFCATCESDNDEDHIDDEEGVEFDVMDQDEQMPELIRDDDDDSVIATEPAQLSQPSQPSPFILCPQYHHRRALGSTTIRSTFTLVVPLRTTTIGANFLVGPSCTIPG